MRFLKGFLNQSKQSVSTKGMKQLAAWEIGEMEVFALSKTACSARTPIQPPSSQAWMR